MIDTKELRQALGALQPDEVAELLDRLEATESECLEQARLNGMGSEREAALMAKLEAAEKERDALRVELNEIRYGVAVAHDTIKALRTKVETAENDAAHQKALAASALRVAEGWERKCGELRAKVAEMEKQEPVAWLHETRRDSDVVTDAVKHVWGKAAVGSMAAYSIPLYALPGAQQCKNCNGMGDRFDPSGEKIPCDLCESNLEEIRVLVAEAVHDIISGGDFWLSTSLAAKKIYAQAGAKGEEK